MQMRLKSAAAAGTATPAPVSSGPPKDVFELSAQLERQAGIIANIKNTKKDILRKQSHGRQLALSIADSQAELEQHYETKEISPEQIGHFEKEQRYTMFVEKMQQLYKNEKRLNAQRNKAMARMEMASVNSTTPIKTVF